MPRLTNTQFINRHKDLYSIWHDGPKELFAILSTNDQWKVHRYYQSSKDLTDQQLIEHRVSITKTEPSLPHQASRGYSRMHQAEVTARKMSTNQQSFHRAIRQQIPGHVHEISNDRFRNIRVIGIARPEPDLERLARALIMQVKEES